MENSAVAKVMSFLFMKRAPPRLIVLPFGALTFVSIEVLLGSSWLLIAYGQDLLRTIGLRFLALRLVLGFLSLFIIFLTTFASFLRVLIISIDDFGPLDYFISSSVTISHLEEFGYSSGRVQSDVLRNPSTTDSLFEDSDNR